MRSSAYAITSRLVAENGLYLPPSTPGGGGGGITQLIKQVAAGPGSGVQAATVISQQSNTLYVSVNGSDVTGNGNLFNPFATYAKAAAVANAAVLNPPSLSNFWTIIFTTGTYTENILLQPFVDIMGTDASDEIILSGTMSLGSGYVGALFLSTYVSNVGIEGVITFDFTIGGATNTALGFVSVFFDTIVVKGNNAGNFVGVFFAEIDSISVDSASFSTQNAIVSDLLTLTASIGPTAFTSSDDAYYEGASLDGSHGFTCAADFVGSGMVGPVTLNGPLAGYASTVDGIGTSITLTGGAPQPIITGSGNATAGQTLVATGTGNWVFGTPVATSTELDGIIFRPGGVAAGNVYTTWATAFAAVTATNGTTILYVDSSITTATVPAGVWDGLGALTLSGYSPGDTIDFLEMVDGAVLANIYKVSGLTIMPAAVTTVPFTFEPDAILFLDELAFLTFPVGALVPMMQAPAGNFLNVSSDGFSGFDNTNAPTVPCIFVPATAELQIVVENYNVSGLEFLTTGNEIGSAVGGDVIYTHDDTTPPLSSPMLLGTTNDVVADPHIGLDGSPAAPSYSYSAARGTGMYRDTASGNLRFAVLGNYVSGFDAFGTLFGFQNSGGVGVPFTLGEGPGADSTWLYVGTNIGTGFSSLATLRASSGQTFLNCPTAELGFALHLSVDGADYIQLGAAAGTPDQVCIAIQVGTNTAFGASLYSLGFGAGEGIIGILNAVTNLNLGSATNKGAGYVWTDTRTDGQPQGLVFLGTGGAGGLGNGARSAVAPCGLGSHNTQAGDEICERAYGRTGPITIGGGPNNAFTVSIPLENGSLRGKMSILGRLIVPGIGASPGAVGDTYYSTYDIRVRTIAGVVTVDFFALDTAGSAGSQASMVGATFTAVGVGSDLNVTIDATAIASGGNSIEDWQIDLYKAFIN